MNTLVECLVHMAVDVVVAEVLITTAIEDMVPIMKGKTLAMVGVNGVLVRGMGMMV